MLVFIIAWLRGPAQGLADALDGFVQPGSGRNFQLEVSGDGIDLGGIERDAAAVDGSDQLTGAGIFVQNNGSAGKKDSEAGK